MPDTVTYTEALVQIRERLIKIETRVNGELLGELRHMRESMAGISADTKDIHGKLDDVLECVSTNSKQISRHEERIASLKRLVEILVPAALALAAALSAWIAR